MTAEHSEFADKTPNQTDTEVLAAQIIHARQAVYDLTLHLLRVCYQNMKGEGIAEDAIGDAVGGEFSRLMDKATQQVTAEMEITHV